MRNRTTTSTRSPQASLRAGPWIVAAAALLAACSPAGTGETSGGGGQAGAGPGAGSGGSGPGPTGARCTVVERGLQISAGKGADPAITWADGRYAAAWTSLDRDGGDIVFALLDPKGKKLRETSVDVGPGVADHAAVVRLESGYVVLWQVAAGTGSTIRALYLGDDGAPRGAAFTIGQSHSRDARPAGVAHGRDAVVAFQDGMSSSVSLLHGSTLSQRQPIVNGTEPALAAAGDHLGVVWLEGSRIGSSRLTVPLGPLDPMLFRDAAGKANLPRVAAHPDGTFDVVWEDDRAGTDAESVYFTRIGSDGKARGEVLVPGGDGSADLPDVAFLGGRSAVVYYQFRDGPPAVFLSLISPDFTREDEDLQISGPGARHPRVAFSGDRLGVVYAERNGPVRLSLVSCP